MGRETVEARGEVKYANGRSDKSREQKAPIFYNDRQEATVWIWRVGEWAEELTVAPGNRLW